MTTPTSRCRSDPDARAAWRALRAAAAATADFDSADTTTLVHAALVHDLGVVAVPFHALRASPHPGSADWEQWRLHPHWTARVLTRCSGLEKVAHAGRAAP